MQTDSFEMIYTVTAFVASQPSLLRRRRVERRNRTPMLIHIVQVLL